MKIIRLIVAIAVIATMGLTTHAEQHQCHNASGCTATTTSNGKPKIVVFRRGDIVNTSSGWIVNPKNGWRKIQTSTQPTEL